MLLRLKEPGIGYLIKAKNPITLPIVILQRKQKKHCCRNTVPDVVDGFTCLNQLVRKAVVVVLSQSFHRLPGKSTLSLLFCTTVVIYICLFFLSETAKTTKAERNSTYFHWKLFQHNAVSITLSEQRSQH